MADTIDILETISDTHVPPPIPAPDTKEGLLHTVAMQRKQLDRVARRHQGASAAARRLVVRLTSRVSRLEASGARLEARVARLEARVAELAAAIDKTQADSAKMSARLDELSGGLAQLEALAAALEHLRAS